MEKSFALLVLLSWGSSKTLTSLSNNVDSALRALSDEDWLRLARTLYFHLPTKEALPSSSALDLNVKRLPGSLADRTVSALEMRANNKTSQALFSGYLSQYRGGDPVTLSFLQRTAIDQLFHASATNRKQWLEVIEQSYSQGTIRETHLPYYYRGSNKKDTGLSQNVARHIADNPDKYPRQLLAIAEAQCRSEVSANVIPVGEIAASENWFSSLATTAE